MYIFKYNFIKINNNLKYLKKFKNLIQILNINL